MADPTKTIRGNVKNFLTAPLEERLRKPKNLKVHNLCRNEVETITEIKETLGLNLGFGISLPPNKKQLPIDFNRLRKSVRAKYIDFDENKKFNKKLYVQKHNTTL